MATGNRPDNFRVDDLSLNSMANKPRYYKGILQVDKTPDSERNVLKNAVMKAAEDFCNMLDCVDSPVGLEFKVSNNSCKVTITAETL